MLLQYNKLSRYRNQALQEHKMNYNIAFVNSKRSLPKSPVDITQYQHGNVGKFISLYSLRYIIKQI